MDDLESICAERDRLWNKHPIITQSAMFPTPAVKEMLGRVKSISRKARASVAYWADPLSGKTFCLRFIGAFMRGEIPGCGVVVFEATKDTHPAEGRLLEQLLAAAGYRLKVERSLAGKRIQVNRVLRAAAGSAGHLFLLIDEGQELSDQEFGWLKAVINGLSNDRIKVTSIIAGQSELCRRQEELRKNARSDLCERFMSELVEFKRVKSEEDLCTILEAADSKSEFPEGSKWTYTKLLLPRAFSSGFRLEKSAEMVWRSLKDILPREVLKKGLRMEDVACLLAEIFILLRNRDSADLRLSANDVDEVLNNVFGTKQLSP